MRKDFICTHCKSEVNPRKKGSAFIVFMLWVVPFIAQVPFGLRYGVKILSDENNKNLTFKEQMTKITSVAEEVIAIVEAKPAYPYNNEYQQFYYYYLVAYLSVHIWIIALIYSLWRFFAKKICPACKKTRCCIPITSLEGKRIIAAPHTECSHMS